MKGVNFTFSLQTGYLLSLREGLTPIPSSRENLEQEGWGMMVENMAFPEVGIKEIACGVSRD